MELHAQQTHDVLVVEVHASYLDASVSETFKQKMALLLKPDSNVLLDLEHLRFIDSSGIGALLWCLHQLQAIEGALKVCALSGPVRHAIELTRMQRILAIFETRQAALAAFESTE